MARRVLTKICMRDSVRKLPLRNEGWRSIWVRVAMNFPIKGEGRNRRTGDVAAFINYGGACAACCLPAEREWFLELLGRDLEGTLVQGNDPLLCGDKEGKHVSKTETSCIKRV